MSIGQTVYVWASSHGTFLRATLVDVAANGRFLISDAYGMRIVPASYINRTAPN